MYTYYLSRLLTCVAYAYSEWLICTCVLLRAFAVYSVTAPSAAFVTIFVNTNISSSIWSCIFWFFIFSTTKTRKLSYHKDGRAMRPIYECPEYFRESLTMPTATFPKIFNGLFFRLMLRICVQNLKFVALPVPEIIGGTQKI